MNKKQLIIDSILNIIIFLIVTIGMTLHVILSIGSGPLDGGGIYTFRYFTNLSNVLCGIVSLIVFFYEINMLKNKTFKDLPNILMMLKQISLAGISVTFATVLFIFVPLIKEEWLTLYSGQKIFTHFITPILCFISFVFFEKGKSFNWKENFLSVIPEVLYAIVYDVEVVIFSNWNDFYGFTLGGKWYAPFIVIPVISAMAYLLSLLFSFLHNKFKSK